jgi:hypothetical protein
MIREYNPSIGFVLLHGAFQNGKVWNDVICNLNKYGYYACAPDMPGRNSAFSDEQPVTLDSYVKTVIDSIENTIPNKVCLVSHSFAGIYGSIAADKCVNKILYIIFIAANFALNGENTFSILPESFQNQLQSAMKTDGLLRITEDKVRDIFCNACSDIQWKKLREVLCGEPAQPYFDKVSLSDNWQKSFAGRIRYFYGTKDKAIKKERATNFANKLGISPEPMEGADHEVMLSQSELLASILIQVTTGKIHV